MKEYIVLVPNNIKNKIIELSRIKYYNYNIKFMSIDTFIKRVTFDFDEKTIYNLMKKKSIKNRFIRAILLCTILQIKLAKKQ